jgi:RNA polymerase sigma factor (sigma-70 family)
MTAQKARRPLTAEAFGKFLRWLSDDDEQAVREYQAVRRRLVRYFILKGCTEADDLLDETVDIVVAKIDSGEEIVSPLAYCYGVAKNVWRQWVRRRRTVSVTRDFVSPEPEDSNAREQELRCLEHCVSQLPPEERDVVTRYHASHGRGQIEARKALASGKGSVNALRVRMCRIRKHLRLCVTDCLERSAKARSFGVQGK